MKTNCYQWLAALLLAGGLTQAQAQIIGPGGPTSLVPNGGFENGPALCPAGNNGPFYLNGGWATDWTGVNLGIYTSSAPAPTIEDATATCFFGQFASGYGPGSGNRAILMNYLYDFSEVLIDIRARRGVHIGPPPLGGNGGYQICVKASGFPAGVSYSTVYNVLQVVLVNTSTGAEKIGGEFTIPNSYSWGDYSGDFFLGSSESYDQLELRLKGRTDIGTYQGTIMVDDIRIIKTPNPPVDYLCSHIATGRVAGESNPQAMSNTSSVNTYPNPATSVLNMQLNSDEEPGDVAVQIMDLEGKVLRTEHQNGRSFSLNVEDLATGMYYVKVQYLDQVLTTKFIKK